MSHLLTPPKPYTALRLPYFTSLACTHMRYLCEASTLVGPWPFCALGLIWISFVWWDTGVLMKMFCYLHGQAFPLMHTFAQQMISHGLFTLAPGQFVLPAVTPLLNQVPT